MKDYKLSAAELKSILEIARLAPSVHNTQPWKVKNTSKGLKIIMDNDHKLGAGDPVGRQTAISLGIFSEAVCIAAENIGWNSKEIKLEDDTTARISFKKSNRSRSDIAELIKRRASDRSIYKKINISVETKKTIQNCVCDKSVQVWFVQDKDFIKKLAKLTSKGIRLALSNPEFRNELSRYLIRSGSNKKRGIAVKSLYLPWFIANLQPESLKLGLNTRKEAELEEKRWSSASAIVLITTDGDLHEDWFNAGRTYLKVSLAIESFGLSQTTSAATVEAATFHEDVEKMLETSQRLQAVLRIGKGAAKKQYSPRVSAEELITLN